MAQDYSPYFPQTENSYTLNGVKFPTNNTNFETKNDLYKNSNKATTRAINIGCSGYRVVTTNSVGDTLYGPCSTYATYQSIMKGMEVTNPTRRWYEFDPQENVFGVKDSLNDRVYEGFEYKEQIFERSMSNLLFRDPTKNLILKSFQRIIYALIETTKQIKNYFNYTVPYNNRRVF